MRSRTAAMISAAACAVGLGLVAVAQPPAETRDGNKSGYKPAFAGQTRAPALAPGTGGLSPGTGRAHLTPKTGEPTRSA